MRKDLPQSIQRIIGELNQMPVPDNQTLNKLVLDSGIGKRNSPHSGALITSSD
jgi:hypothetical protein